MQRTESAIRGPAGGIALCLVAWISSAGCNNSGVTPPSSVLNFPTASAARTLDPAAGPRFLYVANSNFDLRYNSATLQAYDLAVANTAIDALCTPTLPPPGCRGPVPAACAADPQGPDCAAASPAHDECALIPRGSRQATLPAGVLRVCEVGPGVGVEGDAPLLVDEVRIGSFATGMKLSPDGNRLYIAVRSDGDITRVDLDAEGRMDCGGGFGTTDECGTAFRVSDRTVASARDLDFPNNPTTLTVGSLGEFPGHTADEGDYIVMAHSGDDTGSPGSISYFVDPRTGPTVRLLDVLAGFPNTMAALVREPSTGLFWAPSPVGGGIARVGIALDETFAPEEVEDSFLFGELQLAVTNVAIGSAGDLRDLAFDPRPGSDRAYLLSRSPTGILVGSRVPNLGPFLVPTFDFDDVIVTGSGPSRLALAELATSAGPRMFAFVSAYDSRNLYVVDVDLRQVVAVSPEFSGPFEISVDAVRRRLYVTDFRTSVIRIVDLAPMLECLDGTVPASTQECAPSIAGLIGVPDAAEELE